MQAQTSSGDMRVRFFHELVQPYQSLISRSVRNDLVASKVSDIAAASNALAVSAAHFLEVGKLPAGDAEEEQLRQMLQDVADSAKHGALGDPKRTIKLEASLGYEIDDEKGSRFLKTEVWASSDRFGSFDLINTVGKYIETLNGRLQFEITQLKPTIEPGPFNNEAVAKVTKNTVDVASFGIRTYKRDASGSLNLADPGKFTIVVV